MSTVDKAKNKVQEAEGARGKRDKASGNLKQAGEKVKDAFKK